jgi:type III restriction enzyme
VQLAAFLENYSDDEVTSYSKNYFAIGIKLDYVTADGDPSNYYPDFFIKLADGRVFIVETNGREDVDVEPKIRRLREWFDDFNPVAGENRFDFVSADEESFYKHKTRIIAELVEAFREFEG